MLQRAKIQSDVYENLVGSEEIGVFVFTEGANNDDARFATRMFHQRGLREDPATGTAFRNWEWS